MTYRTNQWWRCRAWRCLGHRSHRLICGDATDPSVVATLMQGDTAQLVLHLAAPWQPARLHLWWHCRLGCPDARCICASADGGDGQVLVNLGLIHRDNEVIPYWDGWLSWMRQQGGGASRGTSGIRAGHARRLAGPIGSQLRVCFPLQSQHPQTQQDCSLQARRPGIAPAR